MVEVDEKRPNGNTLEEGKDAKDDSSSLELAKTTTSIAETLSPLREFLFVSIVCLAQLMTQVGLGQTLAILHIIGKSFGVTDPGQLSWLIAGYSLTVGTFILISGRFGDLYGYKRMILIGFAWFSLWSLISGLAVFSNEILFVFSRVLAGIGPAICLPNGVALLGASYPPGIKKNMAFASFGAVAPGGSIMGAAFAGLFALTWWPWTYWSMSIALAVITVVGSFVIPDPPRKNDVSQLSFMEQIKKLDLLGAFVGITALVLINFAWNQAPIAGWSEPYVFVLLIIGFLLVAVFFYVELRISPEPLIPFHALSTDVIFVLGCIALGWGTFGIWIFYLWQILLVLRQTGPLLAAAYLSPAAISGALAAFATGILLSKLRAAWIMVLAMLFFLIGAILIATVPVHQVYWAQIFVASIITPWGMDMSFPSGILILSNAVRKEHQGIAASLINTVVNYSISLALGFAGTVDVHIAEGGMSAADVLKGYRSALYLSVGLSGGGLALSLIFLVKSYIRDSRTRRTAEKEEIAAKEPHLVGRKYVSEQQ